MKEASYHSLSSPLTWRKPSNGSRGLLCLPEPGHSTVCPLWARVGSFQWSPASAFALGYFTRGPPPMRTLEQLKMWVALAWSVLLTGHGLNSGGSMPLKQLWPPGRFWIQDEKATGPGHSQQKCIPNLDWWFWLIRFCRKWRMQLPSSASSL